LLVVAENLGSCVDDEIALLLPLGDEETASLSPN
jgi:hypothetical protein